MADPVDTGVDRGLADEIAAAMGIGGRELTEAPPLPPSPVDTAEARGYNRGLWHGIGIGLGIGAVVGVVVYVAK